MIINNHVADALIRDKFLINFNNFIVRPARTGIQRVCYEFCTRWPYREETIPFVELGMDRIGLLDPGFFEVVRRWFEETDPVLGKLSSKFPDLDLDASPAFIDILSARNHIICEVSVEEALKACRAVLSLEESLNMEFFNVAAATRPEKIFNLCHDFLIWTHSEFFSIDWRSADNVSVSLSNRRKYRNNFFTSTTTRDVFVNQINRDDRRHYAVIPPGADGLGRLFRRDVPPSQEFLVVGTLEPRKQPLRILRVFEELRAQGYDAQLCFAGRMGWLAEHDKKELKAAFKTHSWLRWVDGPSDEALRDLVMTSRATIYLSVAEGFGSPPVESLALGVPCIVSADLPSILDMASEGQVRVPSQDSAALASAVVRLLDDKALVSLQREIETLELPTWHAFVEGIVRLVDEQAPARPGARSLSYQASLDIIETLSLMWQLSRADLIERLLRIAMPNLAERELIRWQATGEGERWTNVEVVLNLGKLCPELNIPAGLVGEAVARRIGTPPIPTLFARKWKERFRQVLSIPDFPTFYAAVYSEILGREASLEELEAYMPVDETVAPRVNYLQAAVSSAEYKDHLTREIRRTCSDSYLNTVLLVTVVWQLRLLDQLAMESKLDRALLLETDDEFINAACLDLTGQALSKDMRATIITMLNRPYGREQALVRLLLSKSCLHRVSDADTHLELIRRLAARAGLVSFSPASEAATVGRVNAVIALPAHRCGTDGFGLFFGRDFSASEQRVAEYFQESVDTCVLAARCVLYGTLRGDLTFSSSLFSWAAKEIIQNSPMVSGEPGMSADRMTLFTDLFGRAPTSAENAVLNTDFYDACIVADAIQLTAIRLGIVGDLAVQIMYFARACGRLITYFEQITELSDKLRSVAPMKEIKPWRRIRANEPDSLPSAHSNEPDSLPSAHSNEPDSLPSAHSAANSAIPMAEHQFHDDAVSVGQLMALDGVDFVRMAYRKLLLREADHGGVETYSAALKDGRSKDSIIYSLVVSPEGKAANANLVGLDALLARQRKLRRWPVRKLMQIAGIQL